MSPLLALLGVIAVGLLVGRISLFGISLGTSAILFIALLAGHFGMSVPEGMGTIGLALFVYCVGISAGPTFFRGLAAQGRTMSILGAMIVLTGAVVAAAASKILGLPAELTGGLMAGALTSTPALGAITESTEQTASVAVGFGVAYPIGIVVVVVFVQLAIKFGLKEATQSTSAPSDDGMFAEGTIQRRAVQVVNPAIIGRRPGDVEIFNDSGCQISRIQINNYWQPLAPEYTFGLDDKVLIVGEEQDLRRVVETLGVVTSGDDAIIDADHQRKTLVVTSPEVYGRTLKELRLRSRFGITVVRIRRHDIEFVPSGRTRIEFGDTLTLVGEMPNLAKVQGVVGHRPRALNETDLLSLAVGLAAGILVGRTSLEFGTISVSLGVAGGPLMVGLILGHFRRIGPIRGSYPPAAQMLMTEGGLALFLSDAGMDAGANIAPVLAEHGVTLAAVAAAIVVIPLAVGFIAARYVFKLTLLQSLGATCGGMTSTPGLAALTTATDSSQPVTSYVAAYPVALVIITVAAPLLVELLAPLTQ
ncbi:aspartate:alanine exchanger family transporter [Rubripirellula tenax]|uniref:aspartate:alanine exchanger family transporter n=1 Tax=Rubripirellula tenax TaxID=2528015 RepID=UPI0011B823EB|nr:TrkA C-terminal domain-containing protein [Rubripirellula tenax]